MEEARNVYIASGDERMKETAVQLADLLRKRRYTVFHEAGIENIRNATDVVIFLNENALANCIHPKDWLRMQYEEAVQYKKNIVLLPADGFDFPNDLPESMVSMRTCKSMRLIGANPTVNVDRLCSGYLISEPKPDHRKLIIVLIVLAALLAALLALFGRDILSMIFPKGIVTGVVSDIGTGNPVEKAVVSVESGNQSAITDADGRYALEVKPGDYTLVYRHEDYLEASETVSVAAKETTALDEALSTGRGMVTGTVKRAVDGSFLENVTVTVGDQSAVTDADGRYSLSAEAGAYQVRFTADGFIDVEQEITVPADGSAECSAVLSEALASNQFRVVLTWGARPTDLDSHLISPDFHIYYGNKTAAGFDVVLDVDDTTGFGPETTTFTMDPAKPYQFYVWNYKPETGAMKDSGAKVEIYQGDQLRAVRELPACAAGDRAWTVFALKDGVIEFTDELGTTEPRITN